MKFMSDFKELEGTVFNSINECKDAETAVLKNREAIAAKEKDKSKLRKKLSADVDKAEENLKKAYENYEKAKESATIILEESNKQVLELLNPAKDAIKEAEAARTKAIMTFNKECGPYQKVYTGDAAEAEFKRISKHIDSIFSNFWKRFW